MNSNPWAIVTAVVLLAGGAAVGWTINGWRLAGELAAAGERHASALRAFEETARRAEQEARARLQAALARNAEITTEYLQEINNAEIETDGLRAAVDRGARRLSIAARCPAAGGELHGAATAGTGTDDTRVELASNSRPDYFDLRIAIAQDRAKIAGLQRYVREVVPLSCGGQPAPGGD